MPNEKIIIVEDEVIISDDLREILEQCGYKVLGTVRSGNDAIELALTALPDVIVMDIRLEGDLDGIRTALRIQEQASHQIHFVFLSAFPEVPSRLESIKSWVYVRKVWAKQELVDAIEKRTAKLRASDSSFQDLIRDGNT